jgi:Ni/Co efflux regulator RcnB
MKKLALIAVLSMALPFAASAQSSTSKAAAETSTKTPAKPVAKAAAKPTAKAEPKKAPIRRSAAKAVEEVTPISEDTHVVISDADMAVAQKVFTGKIQCELGADVVVTADEQKPGFFTVSTKGARYRMHPVESRTGAIRLEDPKAGAMWLQLGNKSMLMNQKQGVRLADECQAPAQLAFADEMKKNPPRSIFESADAPKN